MDEREDILEELFRFGEIQARLEEDYDIAADKYWNSLTHDQQLMAFHSVVKRIVKGRINDQGTYRHVVHDVFKFDRFAYGVGINCGYMRLHNSIDAPVKNRGER